MMDNTIKNRSFLEERFNVLLAGEPDCIKVDDTMAGLLFSKENSSNVIEYLNLLMKTKELAFWQQALLKQCMACCYYFNGEYEKAKEKVNESMNVPAATGESIKRAHYYNNLFGFDAYYNNFLRIDTEHFIFHMDPGTEEVLAKWGETIGQFIKLREEAYEKINTFFNVNLMRKIDYYIWASRDVAREKQSRPLGFAHPEYYLIHSVYNQSIGHETTHIISRYIAGFKSAAALIAEGIAVYFDFTDQDKQYEMRRAMERSDISRIDFKELWLNWSAYPVSISYPASAVLIKHLLENYGEEKLRAILRNQTYESAKSIYGKDLDEILLEVGEISKVR